MYCVQYRLCICLHTLSSKIALGQISDESARSARYIENNALSRWIQSVAAAQGDFQAFLSALVVACMLIAAAP